MHQQSLDHARTRKGKRETSLTKFKNSQSVMFLVVRLGIEEFSKCDDFSGEIRSAHR
jgi:hypothetical protein